MSRLLLPTLYRPTPRRRQILALIVAVAAGVAWCGASPHAVGALGAHGTRPGLAETATVPLPDGSPRHVTCCDDTRAHAEIAVVAAEWTPAPPAVALPAEPPRAGEPARIVVRTALHAPFVPPGTLYHLAVLLLI